MKVIVTAEDISEGIPESSLLCPIALALHRLSGWENARVYEKGILKNRRLLWAWILPMPIEARRFVAQFDLGLHVEPFEFELKL